jgi:hypothetical protein
VPRERHHLQRRSPRASPPPAASSSPRSSPKHHRPARQLRPRPPCAARSCRWAVTRSRPAKLGQRPDRLLRRRGYVRLPSRSPPARPPGAAVRLTAKKLGVLTYLSPELDEDAAVNIGDILAGEIAYAFAKAKTRPVLGRRHVDLSAASGPPHDLQRRCRLAAGSVDAASGHDTMAEIDATTSPPSRASCRSTSTSAASPPGTCSQTMWANVFERLIGASGGVTKDQASGRTIREYNGYPGRDHAGDAGAGGADHRRVRRGDDPVRRHRMAATFGDRRGMTLARSTDYKFARTRSPSRAPSASTSSCTAYGDTTNAGPVVAMMGE